MLHVRHPGSDDVEEYEFLDDEPFLTEISEFVNVIEHGKPVENLLSTFEGTYDDVISVLRVVMTPILLFPMSDACKTYELTWAIRKASEETWAKRTSK